MVLKRFYSFREAKKLILEDSSPSDDNSDVESPISIVQMTFRPMCLTVTTEF